VCDEERSVLYVPSREDLGVVGTGGCGITPQSPSTLNTLNP